MNNNYIGHFINKVNALCRGRAGQRKTESRPGRHQQASTLLLPAECLTTTILAQVLARLIFNGALAHKENRFVNLLIWKLTSGVVVVQVSSGIPFLFAHPSLPALPTWNRQELLLLTAAILVLLPLVFIQFTISPAVIAFTTPLSIAPWWSAHLDCLLKSISLEAFTMKECDSTFLGLLGP